MRKKIFEYSLYFLVALFIVNTDAYEEFWDNFLMPYSPEYPTQSEVGFCRKILIGIHYSYATLTPMPEGSSSKYDVTQLKNLTSAEKVLAYTKEIDINLNGRIDFYFNNDEDLIQAFQKEFNLYLEENNKTIYSARHLYLSQLVYLMENNNENALYVCDIWNDIGNYNYTEKRHREVIDLLNRKIFDS